MGKQHASRSDGVGEMVQENGNVSIGLMKMLVLFYTHACPSGISCSESPKSRGTTESTKGPEIGNKRSNIRSTHTSQTHPSLNTTVHPHESPVGHMLGGNATKTPNFQHPRLFPRSRTGACRVQIHHPTA